MSIRAQINLITLVTMVTVFCSLNHIAIVYIFKDVTILSFF